MGNKINDPIARLMGLRYKSHPWHGIEVGEAAPDVITAFIEMVPTDTVKYELDKVSGYLKIDRPQKYSNVVPALYGFVPQSFCGDKVADYCMQQSNRTDIVGDGDPLDICVLTERDIVHGDIICEVKPIGGFRMLDGNEASRQNLVTCPPFAATFAHAVTVAPATVTFSHLQSLSMLLLKDISVQVYTPRRGS